MATTTATTHDARPTVASWTYKWVAGDGFAILDDGDEGEVRRLQARASESITATQHSAY